MRGFEAAASSGPRRGLRRRGTVRVAVATAAALLLAACGGNGDGDPDPDDPESDQASAESDDDVIELSVAVASFDVAVGEGQRLMAGVFTPERELLTFGEVEFRLGYLGDEEGGEAVLGQEAIASYLPVPGWEPDGDADQPTLQTDVDGQGVYAAEVDLDEPGNYGLMVTAELDDGRVGHGQATFPVVDDSQVPDIGDEAPRTVNYTIDDVSDGTIQPISLDSRAQSENDEIPDTHLHDTVIADAIDEGQPLIVAVSTPVYCQSQFCGPLTETLADIGHEYEDVVDVVMLEVWEDFEGQELNASASEWIETEMGGNEPWVFLVGEDGTIIDRWDNVLDVGELEAHLDELG